VVDMQPRVVVVEMQPRVVVVEMQPRVVVVEMQPRVVVVETVKRQSMAGYGWVRKASEYGRDVNPHAPWLAGVWGEASPQAPSEGAGGGER